MKKTTVILIILVFVTLFCVGLYVYARATLNQFHETGVEAANIDDGISDMHEAGSDNAMGSGVRNEKGYSGVGKKDDRDKAENDPYVKMIKDSKRVNILCIGLAKYSLADTLIVASLDPESNSLDIISIPRDTYFYRPGFESAAEKKINATFYGNSLAERAQSSLNSVRDLLRIPVHHFVKIEYKGVEEIIDAIGGVEVDIPFDMDYDDPTDDLHIHFKKGKRLLNGEDAVKYLRFRQNNDNSHSDGDIGRIGRQQKLIKTAMEKSLGPQIMKIVDIAKEYIKTNMTAEDMMSYAMEVSKIKMENVKMYILPGEPKYIDGMSYYIHNGQDTRNMIMEIYQ